MAATQEQHAPRRRVRVRVDGTVQGVGYRPFVYRLADELDIAGWVLNDERGVLVEAEGPAEIVGAFVGYDGGNVAAGNLADHIVVTRSQNIPRIQEAQASVYHVLRELVELAEPQTVR